jgi:hypothetical protein
MSTPIMLWLRLARPLCPCLPLLPNCRLRRQPTCAITTAPLAVVLADTSTTRNCGRLTALALIHAISIRPSRTIISDRYEPTRDTGSTPTPCGDRTRDDLRCVRARLELPNTILRYGGKLVRPTHPHVDNSCPYVAHRQHLCHFCKTS